MMEPGNKELPRDAGFKCDRCGLNSWLWAVSESKVLDVYTCRGCGLVLHVKRGNCIDGISLHAANPEGISVMCRRDAKPCENPCRFDGQKPGKRNKKKELKPEDSNSWSIKKPEAAVIKRVPVKKIKMRLF